MPRMTTDERNSFLAEPGVLMRIATVLPDGSPLVTPIWYLFEEGAIWFTPREKSEWFDNLRRDPRVCLSIDEESMPYRKVLVQGSVELVADIGRDDDWRDRYRRIAARYVDPVGAEAYIQATLDQSRGLYRLATAEARVRCWRMPLPGEDYSGIWHSKYYRPGTQLKGGADD